MEKQKFYMEVLEIMNGAAGQDFEKAVQTLLMEAIKAQAKSGQRIFNIPTQQMYINMNGVNLVIGQETVKKLADFFKDEGFDVSELGGYTQIQW